MRASACLLSAIKCPGVAGISYTGKEHLKLKNIYERSLLLLSKLPKDAPYRKNTEAIICFKLSVVNEACGDHKDIEENIGTGKIQLLVSQAEAEYLLMQKMMLWKPWERLVEEAPQGQWRWPPHNS